MRLFAYVMLFIKLLFSIAQEERYSGKIVSSTNGEPLLGTHIANLTKQQLGVADANGKFEVPVEEGDTLFISFVGFASRTIFVPFNWQNILPRILYLKPQAQELEEVTVSRFPYYNRFKELLLETQAPDTSFVVFGLDQIPLEVAPYNPPVQYDAAVRPAVGQRFDAGFFSKRARKERKTQKALKANSQLDKVAKKMPRKWVAEVTNLQGDLLTDFIAYCNFEPKYILRTPLYIIQERITVLLEEFLEENGDVDDSQGA
ncbi:MAG: carboxypeptidase-like regulatory domain-containing protein [Bacteroidota bacterium]